MANVVGSATIRIIPDTSGFSAALRGQLNNLTGQISAIGNRNITGNLSTQLNALGNSLERTGTRAALVGQAFTYGLTRPLIRASEAIIGVAADFDEAARTVAAITIPDPIDGVFESMDMFEERVQQYKDSARKMARETVFSSTEVERAYVDLARAGLTTADQLESVIGTVANVALVEGGTMADFSDRLVQIFTGFGGNFEEVGAQYKTIFGDVRATTADLAAEFEHMTDILALTSQRTVTNITDLAVAFRYAGPTAKAAGLSFAETSAALGMLAQAGFDASMGGTALRGIITRLAIPTKLSEKIYEKFGLTMEQAFQPENAAKLLDTLHDLGVAQEEIDEIMARGYKGFKENQEAIAKYGFEVFDATGKMKPLVDIIEEFVNKGARVGDIGKAFGQRAGPAFQGLMDNLPALKRLTAELEGAEGALDRMAERMKTSASVQFKLLKNSLIELAIAFGESGVLKFFSDLSANLRDFVMRLADTNPEILKIVGAIGLLVAAIGPLTLVFGLWTSGWGKFLRVLAFSLTPLGAVVTAIGAISAAFAIMLAKSEPLRGSLFALFETAKSVVAPFIEIGKVIAEAFRGEASQGINGLALAVKVAIDTINKAINEWIKNGGLENLVRNVTLALGKIKEFWDKAKFVIIGALLEIGETGKAAFDLLVVVVREVWDGLSNLADAVLPVLAVAFGIALKAAALFLDALEGLFEFLKPIAGIISDVLGPALLLLADLFLLAKINGFNFAQVFGALRSEIKMTDGTIVEGQGRLRAFINTVRIMIGTFSIWNLGGAMGTMVAGVVKAFGTMVVGIGRAIGLVTDILGAGLQRIGEFLTKAQNYFARFGFQNTVWQYVVVPILDAMSTGISAISSVVKTVASVIAFGFIRAFTFATQTVPNMALRLAISIRTALSSAMESASGAVSALRTSIRNALATAFSTLTNLNAGSLAASLNRVLISIPINVAGIAAVLRSALSNAILSASVAARSAMDSIVNAITSRLINAKTAVQGAITSISQSISDGLLRARVAVQITMLSISTAIVDRMNAIKARIAGINFGEILTSFGTALSNIGPKIVAFGTNLRNTFTQVGASGLTMSERFQLGFMLAFEKVKVGAMTMANVVRTATMVMAGALQIASVAMMGFMQGMMIGQAEDFKGKLMALIPALMGIASAMAMVSASNPFTGLIVVAQTFGTLIGTILGRMKKDAVDLSNSISGIASALEMEAGASRMAAMMNGIRDAVNSLDPENFSILAHNLKIAGLSVDDLNRALLEGSEATDKFLKKWEEREILREMSKFRTEIDSVTGKLKVINIETGALKGTFRDMADAEQHFREGFNKRLDVQAVRNLAENTNILRNDMETYKGTLAATAEAEEKAASGAVSLGRAVMDASSAVKTMFDELKAQLRGFNPTEDLRKATDDLIDTVEGMGKTLDDLDNVKNNVDWNIPAFDDNSERARKFRDQIDLLKDSFYQQAFAIGMASKSNEEYSLRILGARQQLMDLLVSQGATIEQASILADYIAETTGVKYLTWSTNFETVSKQLDQLNEKQRVLQMSMAESETAYRKQIAEQYPHLSPEQQEFVYAFSGGAAQYRADLREKHGAGGVSPPTIQAPGGVTIKPDSVAGMPSQGIPSQVTVSIVFSAIENMDAVLAQITGFTDSVKTRIAEIAQGVTVLGMVVAQTVMASIQAIISIPTVLSTVAQMAMTVLMAVVRGVNAVVISVVSGLMMIPTVTMTAVSTVSVLFNDMALRILATTTTMMNGVIALFGSLIQYILLTSSTMNTAILQIITSAATGFSVMANSAVAASIVIVSAITQITLALMRIPSVMEAVGQSIARGFSQPFNLIASSVWNPFASFINSAASAFGLGPLLPADLSIPVFHKGGIVGDRTGDFYDGSRSTTQDEVFALLQKGEGVMSKQMMANMTAAQISAFKRGDKRWWAVGGPYESGKGQAEERISSGYAFNSPDAPNFEQIKAFYEGIIKPLIGSVTATYPGNLAANIGGTSMSRLGDATVEYTRGYTDRMTEEQRKFLVQIGLPPDFDLNGVLPTGFNLFEWRSFLGANKKPGSWPLIAAYLNAAGVPYLINSTLRPDDIGSYHASGRAIDLGAPGDANYDSPGLLRINHALAPLLGVLAELIYSGPGGISDKAYDAVTMAQHHNHVHAALRDGGIIQGLVYAMLGEDGPEVVIPLNDPNRALSLARRSGLLRTLQDAQNRSTSYSSPSAASNARSVITGGGDDGILGGTGNTYHIYGISWEQVRRKIENRDKAALRRRR